MTTMLKPAQTTGLQDVVLLLARVALGAVMIAHGWQKVTQGGLGGTTEGFASMGIPAPGAAAAFAIAVELGGGALLVLGALTPVVGVAWALSMLGASWFAHRGAFFADGGGYEFTMILAVLGLVLAATGAGRLSLDALLARRSVSRSEERETVDA